MSWVFGALTVTVIVSAYSYTRERSWSSPTPVRTGIAEGAMMFIPAAVCFIGPTVLIARRLRHDRTIAHRPRMLAGATLTACTWLAICAVFAFTASH